MINKTKILEIANKQGRITTKELSEQFDVSRQYINQLMSELVSEKEMIKIADFINRAVSVQDDDAALKAIALEVKELMKKFPMPRI